MANEDFWTRFWDIVCDHHELLKVGFAIPVMLIILQLIISPAVEPGTASYVIMVFNFAVLVPLSLVILYFIRRCSTRTVEDRF